MIPTAINLSVTGCGSRRLTLWTSSRSGYGFPGNLFGSFGNCKYLMGFHGFHGDWWFNRIASFLLILPPNMVNSWDFLMVIYGDLMGTYPPVFFSAVEDGPSDDLLMKKLCKNWVSSIHSEGDVHDFFIPILRMTRLAGMMIPIHWLGHQYSSEGFWGHTHL